MDAKAVEDRLFKTIKKFGVLIGSWPFGRRRLKLVGRISLIVLMFTSIVTQTANAVVFYSIDVLTEQVIYLAAALGVYIKLGNQVLNETKFKRLLDGLFKDWEVIKSKEELAIMNEYADKANLWTNLYLGTAYSCAFVFTQMPLVVRLLDVLMPRNESRELLYVYPVYYFVDPEKYYYYILFHSSLNIYIVVLVYVYCDTSYVCLVQHSCALLVVAGYRFKHAIQERDDLNECSRLHLLKVDLRNLRYSIQGHARALKFVEELEKTYEVYFPVSLTLIISAFCLTLVKASSLDMSPLFMKYVVFVFVQLIHLLFLTVQGQFVMNAGDEAYNMIYEGLWYNTAPKLQTIYVLALRRSLVTPVLTAGGLVVLNLPTFAEVVRMSVSYYTVLRTT